MFGLWLNLFEDYQALAGFAGRQLLPARQFWWWCRRSQPEYWCNPGSVDKAIKGGIAHGIAPDKEAKILTDWSKAR